jgi:hypothetical protein
MTNEEIKGKLIKISNEKYKGGLRFFKPKYLKTLIGEEGLTQIKASMMENMHEPLSFMLYCFVNDYKEIPKCSCGVDNKFNTSKSEFSKYCSNKCRFDNFDESITVRKKTNLLKYGATNVLASDFGKRKIKETNLKKYGVDNYTKTEEYREKYSGRPMSEDNKVKASNRIMKSHYDNLPNKFPTFTPLFSFDEYNGVKGYKEYKWNCKSCGNDIISSMDNGSSPVCRICKPDGSDIERFVMNILDEYDIKYKFADRDTLSSGREIDINIPDKKMGIEMNGLLYHSTYNNKYTKEYHLNKLLECEENGIELLSIFADEVYHKPSIVRNRIKSKMGLLKRSIYARKCEVREIDHIRCSKFLNKYHIQGSANSSFRYGLFYKNRMVAIMTFNKGRKATGHKSKDNVYELCRYVTIGNFKVIGGAGKLLKHFIKEVSPQQIYSYSDRRWGNGNLYQKLGFIFSKDTIPNYWYTKDFKNRLHRMRFQKGKLKHFPNYSPEKTEEIIMKEMKYFKTWDCGSKLFTMDF